MYKMKKIILWIIISWLILVNQSFATSITLDSWNIHWTDSFYKAEYMDISSNWEHFYFVSQWNIYHFQLTIPYDFNSKTYIWLIDSDVVLGFSSNWALKMKINWDWTKAYIIEYDTSTMIKSYSLTTPYDLTTLSYLWDINLNTYSNFKFTDNWNKLLTFQWWANNLARVRLYNLNIPYEISSNNYIGYTDLYAWNYSFRDWDFSSDWLHFISYAINEWFRIYNLTIPYDLTTAIYDFYVSVWSKWHQSFITLDNKLLTNDDSNYWNEYFYTYSTDLSFWWSNIPDNAICSIKSIPNIWYQKIVFWDNTQEFIEDEKILITEWLNNFSISNWKSFSWSLKWLINWDNSFEFDSKLISNQTPVFKINSWTWSINYFEVQWEWNFYPLVYIPYDDHYKVKVCGQWYLLNPEQSNNHNVIWNEWQIYFEVWKKYTLPVNYKCLEFEFYLEIIWDVRLDKFEVWEKTQVWILEKEICIVPDTDETFIDWESFTWSLDNIWNDWSVEIKNMSVSDKLGVEFDVTQQAALDINWDWEVSINEATWWFFSWFFGLVEWIKNTANNVKWFLDAFWDFWNVEQKDLFSWLIPTTNAENKILDSFWNKANEFKEWDSKPMRIFKLIYWTIITIVFIYIIYSVKNRND